MNLKEMKFKLYNLYNHYYVFDYMNLLIVEISEELYSIMKSKSISEKNNELYTEWLKMMDANGFFKEDIDIINLIENQTYIKSSISFPSVHSCNLACKYCFAKSGTNYTGSNSRMNEEVVDQIIKKCCNNYFKNSNILKIDFVSGGEPLLNFDLIYYLIKNKNHYEKIYNKQIEIFLCTNATLLTRDIIEILNSNNIDFGISLDGYKKINDQHRIYHNGTSTYDDVVSKISHIVRSTDYSSQTKNFWVLGVITSKTDSIVQILKHYRELGIKNVQLKICRLEKDNELSLKEDNINHFINLYVELTKFIKAEAKNNNLDYLMMILNDNDYYGKILKRLLIRDISTRRCSVGRSKLSFAANGDIYPCDSFVGMPDYKIGNVFDEQTSNSNRLTEVNVNISPQCQTCDIRYICGGDCYYNSLLVNKDILVPDKLICEINKQIVECCVDLICYMNINCSEKLDYITNVMHHRR